MLTMVNYSEGLTDEELALVKQLREKLGDYPIPADLDTDFSLARWIRVFGDRMDVGVTEFKLYVESRRVLGCDGPHILNEGTRTSSDIVRKYGRYLATSCLGTKPINKKDGTLIYYERTKGVDFNQILQVAKISDFVSSFVWYKEYHNQMILELEKKTGKPASVCNVMDLAEADVASFVNPMGAPQMSLRCMCYPGAEWYGDTNHKMYFLNPPSVVSVVWELVKLILPERMQERVVILANPTELLEHISADAVPKCYGGELEDAGGWGDPQTCVNEPSKVTEEDYYPTNLVFKGMADEEPEFEYETIQYEKTFTVVRTVAKPGQHLVYKYQTSNEVHVTCFHVDGAGKKTRVLPRFMLLTPLLPEEGSIACEKSGEYHFEFYNAACYWFPVNLEYVIALRDDAPPPRPVTGAERDILPFMKKHGGK